MVSLAYNKVASRYDMLRKLFILSSVALAIGTATYLVASWQSDGNQGTIIRREMDGRQLEFFHNVTTVSQAFAMNEAGSIIGYKEDPTTRGQVFFFWGQDGPKNMPKPKGFTAVDATAISDTELVVGRTMKPIGAQDSLRAVAWSTKSDDLKLLPLPPDHVGCNAADVSSDGTRITGYASGRGGLKPVLWQWDAKQSAWQVEVLPTLYEDNPYLMSSQLLISPDGKTIAGCCTENLPENGTIDSALYQWQQVDGKWTRRLVTEQQMYVKGLNNKGQIAGSVAGEKGRMPCLVTAQGKVKILDLLPEDVQGEARDINEEGTIVGWSDDPPGPDGSPTPCAWNLDGKVTEIKISTDGVGMLFAINNKGQMAGTADVVLDPAGKAKPEEEEPAILAVRVTSLK